MQTAARQTALPEPRKLERLSGHHLRARDGDLGRLKEVFFDDVRWGVRYFVVHTGPWLLGRDVLIVPSVVTAVDDRAEVLEVDLDREQVRNAPPVSTDLPVSRRYEHELYRYYGWDPYWLGDPMLAPSVFPTVDADGEDAVTEDHHLRSSREVTGYTLEAADGGVGQVADLLLEEATWAVRYLEVDMGHWPGAKRVLLAPAWIDEVDWARQRVTTALSREAIHSAPPFDPDQVVSRAYQVALYEHYGSRFDGA